MKAILSGLVCLLLGFSAFAETQTRVVSYEYDLQGRRTKEVVEPDQAQHCQQTTYAYDGFGNRKSATLAVCPTASGYTISSASTPRVTSATFSANGKFATGMANALGHAEAKTYDAKFGVVKTLTGPNGLVTSWDYDGFGRKTKETRADGTFTTWIYLLCTQPGASCPSSVGSGVPVWTVIEQGYTTVGGTNSPVKYQFYDKLGRVIRVLTQGFDTALVYEDTEYDAQGLVARKSTPYVWSGSPVWTNFTYDALGRVTQKTRPDPVAAGGVATTTYGYAGPTTSTTNAKNQTKTAVTGARGQITQVTDAKGSVITYGWDAFDQLTQVNASGAITTLTYTVRGFKKAMSDASMGAWTYEYNAFGELVSQRDSLNQTTALSYDLLGRMTQRSEPDLVSDWSYDKKFNATACGKGVGKLCEATANNGYKRTHNYDTLGRPDTTATVLDNPASPATVTETYHPQTGRVATKAWPTGFQASYAYTSLGYLQSVSAAGAGAPQTVTYTVSTMNPLGQVTQWLAGNQVVTVNSYHAQTHRLMGIQATKSGQATGNVLNHAYTWDAVGNLATRADTAPGVGTSESFSYDSVNQLTLATLSGGAVSPPSVTEVMYDARGNITYKSDVGVYTYDSARANRLIGVAIATPSGAQVPHNGTRALAYTFDDGKPGAQSVNGTAMGNGNLESTVSHDTANNRHTGRTESYTSFNMPLQVAFGNVAPLASTVDRTLTFVYGPEHQRVRQNVALSGSGTSAYTAGSTWYMNGIDSLGLSYEKLVTTGGMTEHKHYVTAAGQVFALYVSRSGTLGTQTATTTSYMHTDHLGSTAAITDASGTVVERLAYDPWGKRRFTTGLPDNADAIAGQKTDRGYTMHEHLDEVGVVHMNARLYDPLVGRFMSADSIIPNPTDLKAFNRYAYVTNNPLRLIDPTGHFHVPDDPDAPSGGPAGGASGSGGGGGGTVLDRVDVVGKLESSPVEVIAAATVFDPVYVVEAVPKPSTTELPRVDVVARKSIWDVIFGRIFTFGGWLMTFPSPLADGTLNSNLTLSNRKPPENAYDPNGPKAPGRPTEADGFKPPKDGDQWVRNPNGKGYGWLADDGRVWVPTGPGGLAHGGPHWDVQTPGGEYENVYPQQPEE